MFKALGLSAWAVAIPVFFGIVTHATVLLAQQQPARSNDEALAGRQVAIRECGECHAVDPGRTSPFAPAPPFPGLYRIFPVERLNEVLAQGMLADHPNMSAFAIDEDERLALTAYLTSFRPPPASNGEFIKGP